MNRLSLLFGGSIEEERGKFQGVDVEKNVRLIQFN